MGLSETRRHGEELTKLRSGHLLYHKRDDSSQGGVGLLVHKSFSDKLKSITAISTRVIYGIFHISDRYKMKVVQVYAPTSKSSDDVLEEFYSDVEKALSENLCYYTVVMGDFNAKIGQKAPKSSEDYVGKFGLGIRNKRGKRLVNFLTKHKLYAMNTFFQKKDNRKWTWVSPGGNTKNQIDYILVNKKQITTDVSVLNKVNIGSNHRLVRARMSFNVKKERNKMLRARPCRLDYTAIEIQKEHYQKRIEQIMQNQPADTVHQLSERLSSAIRQASEEIGKNMNQRESILTENTKQLMAKRQEQLSSSPGNLNVINKQV
ncbi:hypothetical protein ABMA28_000739 [Loxostege sticticalis]|uniref:Endonuclease/exonuclease/phosphatase domain-containing protein n=1 Tax=Loxostege sticticalis TaxID=481309 RepID=A0ABD0T3D1_LOXSC